jgi:hypothetical protein
LIPTTVFWFREFASKQVLCIAPLWCLNSWGRICWVYKDVRLWKRQVTNRIEKKNRYLGDHFFRPTFWGY